MIPSEFWADIRQVLNEVAKKGDAAIAALCRQRGIADEVRPILTLCQLDRREDARSKRLAQLQRKGEELMQAYHLMAVKIIKRKVDGLLDTFVSEGRTPQEVRELVDSAMNVKNLMWPIVVRDLEQELDWLRPARRETSKVNGESHDGQHLQTP